MTTEKEREEILETYFKAAQAIDNDPAFAFTTQPFSYKRQEKKEDFALKK